MHRNIFLSEKCGYRPPDKSKNALSRLKNLFNSIVKKYDNIMPLLI